MADYNTQQRRRNVIVGGFVIIAFCALIWMIAIFGELPVMATEWTSYEVTAQFPEAAGIQKTTPVRYLGYPVGKVTQVSKPKLELTEERRAIPVVLARLAIDEEFRSIPANVRVRLTTRSMGSSFIELLPADEPVPMKDGKLQFLEPGAKLYGFVGTANEFIPEDVQEKLEDLVTNITDLTTNLNDVIGDEQNKKSIKETLANFSNMTAQASTTLSSIEELSLSSKEAVLETKTSIKQTLDSVLVTTEQATQTLAAMEELSASGKEVMVETAASLDDALVSINNILYKISEGEGTAAKLLNDGKLYEDLLDSVAELEMALKEFKNFAENAREEGLKVKL